MLSGSRDRSAGAAFIAALIIPLAWSSLLAQSSVERHSHASKPVERLGVVVWPTSASPAAHASFIRGVLLLHNFHYEEAIAAFRAAQRSDPGDVMSYWGEAVSYTGPVWNDQNVSAARAALLRLAPTREARLAKARTPWEREWLRTAEALYDGDTPKAHRDTIYAEAMEKLHAARPTDPEAATFYALALLGLNQGQRESIAYAHAYAVAESVFRSHPHHPGAAHYLIHAVDDPEHARLGLPAARRYSRIASSAGHALHMTSHIFMALGMWDDVVRANADAQATVPDFLLGHVVIWLGYGLIQQGRLTEAKRWIDSMQAQSKNAKVAGARRESTEAVGELSAYWNASTTSWSAPVALLRVDTTGIDATLPLMGTALGALGRGDRALADSMLSGITALRRADSVRVDSLSSPQGWDIAWQKLASARENTLRAMLLAAGGRRDSAIALLRAAAAIEESAPVEFGPPGAVKPPREAAGELLLTWNRLPEAEEQFRRALARTPRRTTSLLGLARTLEREGKSTEARARYAELSGIWHQADRGLPEVVEARSHGGSRHSASHSRIPSSPRP